VTGEPTLDEVVAAVRAHEPDVDATDDGWSAATALVLADLGDGHADVLFIERASRPGDRWSGQMALPGGKRDPGDRDLEATAVRETREEVGVHLPPAVGRLDDLRDRGGRRGRVATTVHVVTGRPPTVPEPGEVESVVWIGLTHLFHPASSTRYWHGPLGPFAGIQHGEHTVWGLTLGTLRNLAVILGRELPRPRGPLLG
jgi:8-oxo-dGTP pyrophosphatase MutT (NUDIX family)